MRNEAAGKVAAPYFRTFPGAAHNLSGMELCHCCWQAKSCFGNRP